MSGRYRFRFLWACILAAFLVGCSAGSSGTPQTPPAAGTDTPPAAPSGPQRGGELRMGLHRDPAILDPHVSQGASSIYVQGSIYETLVQYDADGRLVGGLAEKWTIADDTTYTFILRKGVKFHDGLDFTATDVIASFKRIGSKETNATRRETIEGMVSYEAVDQHTVKVVLKQPNAVFLHELASNASYIVSAADIEQGFPFRTKTNGTGPFKLESWEPNSKYVLVRNPDYWREGLPYLDRIVMTPIVDDKARINSLRSGENDLVEYVPWQEIDTLSRDYDLYKSGDAFNLVRLHHAQGPTSNKYLRQALNYIVDRQEILNLAFGGQGRLITGPLQQPGSPYYRSELENHYRKDHAKALELLKQAGYNSPAEVPPLEFTVGVIAVHSETAQVVQQQLKDFGLTINWKSVESVRTMRTSGEYTMMMDGLSMAWPDPDYMRPYFHSRGTGHAIGAKMANARLDELLDRGARITDDTERIKLYTEAEQIILDEAPWIFLFWRGQAEALHKKVKGYVTIPAGLGGQSLNRLEYLWIDPSVN